MKNKILSSLLFPVMFMLVNACTTYYEVTEDERLRIENSVSQILSNSGIENAAYDEKEILFKGLVKMLEYIEAKEKEGITDELDNIENISELRDFISIRSELTPLELGQEAIAYWNEEADNSDFRNELRTSKTDHFSIEYYADSKAYNDIRLIEYYSEYFLSSCMEFINEYYTGLNNFSRNIKLLSDERIKIMLLEETSSGYSTDVSVSINSDVNNNFNMEASVKLPFYNVLSLEVMARALTIIMDVLIKTDMSKIELVSDDKEAKNNIVSYFDDLKIFNSSVNYGFCEYLAVKFSIFNKYGLLLSPENRIKQSTVDLKNNVFYQNIRTGDKDFIIKSNQVGSFISYLIYNYGAESFLEFYYETGLSENDFNAVYKKDYLNLQNEWKAYLEL